MDPCLADFLAYDLPLSKSTQKASPLAKEHPLLFNKETRPGLRKSGRVKFFDCQKGYGFIIPDNPFEKNSVGKNESKLFSVLSITYFSLQIHKTCSIYSLYL